MDTKEVAKLEPREELKTLEVSGKLDISKMVKSVGDVVLTDEQKKIIYKDIDPMDVEIRPDGIIYLPWVFFHKRMREAFGWEFALIPKSDPHYNGEEKLMMWGFYMVVKGSLLGFAIGECPYHSNNPIMSYADAMEGCKSNAVTRLCKDLGLFPELWQPEFRRQWITEYAISYQHHNAKKGRTEELWRKKTDEEREKAPVSKDPEYLAIENDIRLIIEDPDFTGMIMYNQTETDLNYYKAEMMSRLASGTVYKVSTLEKMRDTLRDMLSYRKQLKEIPAEEQEVNDVLGDEDTVYEQPSAFPEEEISNE